MFILHTSNRTENLVEHLASVLHHDPLPSPFSKEIFVIQSQGLERWLSQQLAARFDVWANYQFLFPWKFFAFITEQLLGPVNDQVFDQEQLPWRLEAILRHLNHEACRPLENYLAGNNRALKRFQLAKHLAQIFSQYQIMRTDLLSAWENNKLLYNTEVEHWQKALWQELRSQITQPHRGEQWLQGIAKLNAAREDAFNGRLPERISIFGINTMPPLLLTYLASLSRHCQVHFYLLNPAESYWADLARKQLPVFENETDGNPLLRRLGQQGREFQGLLLELPQFDYEPQSFKQTENPNNLQQLQNDILNNNLSAKRLTKDHSIGIHACHSRKREVEVLKDQLLFAFEDNKALQLRDIVVMAPDIRLYEPYISAVFHDIQHSIADRNLREINQYLDIFFRFLTLSQSRLGWQSVLDLLACPVVHPAFDLSESDLELIDFWVQDLNVRWGQSGEHKRDLGLPHLDEYTWQAALDRLLMGYAVGDDDDFVLGILPYKNIEGSSASALGGLNDFLQLLFKAKEDFKSPKSLEAWSNQLRFYVKQLFGHNESLELQPLNELLQDLSVNVAAFHRDKVETAVVLQWLDGAISERISVNGFLRGQLTFCSMIPMRAIPFQVIALLGMNDGEFPRIDSNPTFDLISQHFRKGDRSRRADDRYQFLEVLLSARQQLILTYIGQSQATNETIPPSVVVSELIEVLEESHQLNDLVIFHPLQSFSPRYFNQTPALFSFSQTDCAIAQALSAPKRDPDIWWQGSIDEVAEEIIEVADIFRFFQHPQRYFLRERMGVKFDGIYADTEEREPFALDDLNPYKIQQDWIAGLLEDKPLSLAKLKAQGQWPSGGAGEMEFERQSIALADFVNRVRQINVGEALDDLSIDRRVGDFRLAGRLGNRFQTGNLIYRYAVLKGKDLINAWLTHLILNLQAPQPTYLLTIDETLKFAADQSETDALLPWLNIYFKGRQRPDVFFTEAALAYLKHSDKRNAKKSALDEAKDYFTKSIGYDNEYELRQLYANYGDLSSVLTEAFAECCEALLVPVWRAAREN